MQTSLGDGLRLEQLILDMLLQTEDGEEGPAAFSAREKPVYKRGYCAERLHYL
jgi:hypothetical protein